MAVKSIICWKRQTAIGSILMGYVDSSSSSTVSSSGRYCASGEFYPFPLVIASNSKVGMCGFWKNALREKARVNKLERK